MRPRRLLLVKHARPDLDPARPAREWRLSLAGRADAARLAERLATTRLSAIVSSTEPKALETAAILGRALDVAVEPREGLHEHDRRDVGFLGESEFASRIDALFDRPEEVVFGVESAREATMRFCAAVDEVVAERDGDLVIVSHGTVIALFAAARAGLDAREVWRTLDLPSYIAFEVPGFRVSEIVAAV